MSSALAFKSTKWALDLATRLIKADIRLHRLADLTPEMSILFVVNHFTRLETIFLPYELHKATGLEVWSLADEGLFVGKVGAYMRAMGTVSTKDPDRDKIIVRSLLRGDHPWIIFPEGLMVKDKKVVDPAGAFRIFHRGIRRPPHTGAASLALRAEFYRHKLGCLAHAPSQAGLEEVLKRFDLSSFEQALSKRTVIVPVNVTYFPMRAGENPFVRLARAWSSGLGPRALEELSLEGTLLSADTDIDITLGEPIDARKYLETPEYAELMACGPGDLAALEENPRSAFNDAARQLMLHHMSEIYRLTTLNYDHIFATLIRHQRARRFTERQYRNRIFLSTHRILAMNPPRVHSLLARTYRDILYEDYSPKFHSFVDLCVREGLLRRDHKGYTKNFGLVRGKADFHAVRMTELTEVIANEIEPLPRVVGTIAEVARIHPRSLSEQIREIFLEEDCRLFEEDYARHRTLQSPPPKVGRPFLLSPKRPRAGVVLVHGYLSAPQEVRALAEYLFRGGYAVYGVRLRGHGTSPEDLARTPWEEWYESLNRGYAVIKSLTDRIIVGGFSTGGGLALLASARKGNKVQAAFAINTPLHLKNAASRFASPVATFNWLLERFGGGGLGWDFISHTPENPRVNYDRIPVSGVAELGKAMEMLERSLPDIRVPILVVQGTEDPIVDPESAYRIVRGVGSSHREAAFFARTTHGIINGPESEEIFARVLSFLRALGARRSSGDA
ncbi:MAG: alpha/beta fold hydrolase [Candidatus Omnitrophica bacterium]|nr:alpha/beta fold hydrolase [Candidatus Omnitrophota bacterium]